MPRGKICSVEIIAKIEKLVKLDFTKKEIAAEVELTPTQVYGLMRRNHITLSDAAKKKAKAEVAEQARLTQLTKNQTGQDRQQGTLCIYCRRTNLHQCSLFHPDIVKPPDGAIYKKSSRGFTVKSCKNFLCDKRGKDENSTGNTR